MTAKINAFCTGQLGLESGKSYELYKKYGTCLRGLMEEKIIGDSDEEISSFLEAVHDISYEVGASHNIPVVFIRLSCRKSPRILSCAPCCSESQYRGGSSPLQSRVMRSAVSGRWVSTTYLRASSTAGKRSSCQQPMVLSF